MYKDITRIFDFLKTDDGKKVQNRIIIIISIIFVMLMVNRFFLVSYISDDYKIAYHQSRLLFKNGVSPYASESQRYVAELAETEGWELINVDVDLENPIFQLILYFPFTLIKDYQWSEAVFVTINQICVLIAIHMLFNLLDWKTKSVERFFIYLFSITVFFVTTNLMATNIAPFQLIFIVGALFFDEKRKPILSGIFFGLSIIDPISMFYMLTTMAIILIITKRATALIWTSITVFLMTLFSLIFERNWVLGWLKSLFLTPSRYPFLSFIKSASLKYNFQFNRIFTVIPILLISWVLFELIRTPKDTIEKKIWIFSITGILNHYLMVQPSPNSEILFLFTMILLIAIWWDKVKQKTKIALYVLVGILSYSVYKWPRFNLYNNNELILSFISLFFLINLYWIRAWVMKPYYVNTKDKNIL